MAFGIINIISNLIIISRICLSPSRAQELSVFYSPQFKLTHKLPTITVWVSLKIHVDSVSQSGVWVCYPECGFQWRFTLILLPMLPTLPPRVWVSMKVVLQETVGSPPLRCLRSTAQQANRLENQNRVKTNRGTRKASAAHLITVPLWYNTFIFTLVNLCYSSDVSTVWTPHCTVHSHDLCSLRHITPQDSFLLWSLRLERKQNRTEQQLVQDLQIKVLTFHFYNSPCSIPMVSFARL